MDFFRIAGLECVNRGKRSESTERARELVMMCGRVFIGRDIVIADADVKSYIDISIINNQHNSHLFWKIYLLQEICSQHENFGVRPKALHSAQISNSLLHVFR